MKKLLKSIFVFFICLLHSTSQAKDCEYYVPDSASAYKFCTILD